MVCPLVVWTSATPNDKTEAVQRILAILPVIETDAGASLNLADDTHPATADFYMMQSCQMGLANRWCPNRKPAIYVGNIIGLVMNVRMVNGIVMHAGWIY
jgi:hypothetical protein